MAPRLSADAAILHITLLATNGAIPTARPWATTAWDSLPLMGFLVWHVPFRLLSR